MMIETNCKCKVCDSPVVLHQVTMGIATNLHLQCLPSLPDAKVYSSKISPDCIQKSWVDSASNYIINYLLIVAMMSLGLGMESVVTFLALLGI